MADQSLAMQMSLPFDEQWLAAWEAAFLGARGWHGPVTRCTAEDAQRSTRAVVGLAWQRRGFFRFHALAGYYWPSRGIGITGNGDVQALARQLAANLDAERVGTVIRIGPVASNDIGTQAFIAALRASGWRCLWRDSGVVMRLDLPSQLEDLSTVASASMLKNLAYLRRRLEKQQGEVQSVRVSLRCVEAGALIERLARIEEASWVAGEGGEPKFSGSANRAFWSAQASVNNATWEPVVWILQVRGVDIAFSAHLETESGIWIIANSFDSHWKAHSPGSLLTLAVLEHAIANRVRVVDWGQGDSGYKGRWGAKEGASLQEYLMFPPGLRAGALYWAASKALKGWATA